MQMEVGLDTGPVLATRGCTIDSKDTAGSLTGRLAELGAAAAGRNPGCARGRSRRRPDAGRVARHVRPQALEIAGRDRLGAPGGRYRTHGSGRSTRGPSRTRTWPVRSPRHSGSGARRSRTAIRPLRRVRSCGCDDAGMVVATACGAVNPHRDSAAWSAKDVHRGVCSRTPACTRHALRTRAAVNPQRPHAVSQPPAQFSPRCRPCACSRVVLRDGRSLGTTPASRGSTRISTRARRRSPGNWCSGPLRYLPRLEAWLAHVAPRPPRDAAIRAIALLGLYQLGFTRVPPHAAVSTSVELTRAIGKSWAAGFVNAVLRRFGRRTRRHRMYGTRREGTTRTPRLAACGVRACVAGGVGIPGPCQSGNRPR